MSGVKGSLSASSSVKMPELRGRLDQVSSMQGTLSNTFLRGLSAYQEALLSGFDGTRDEWIESLKGKEVQLRENDNSIEWKYEDDEEWTHLISLEPTRDYEKLVNRPTLGGVIISGEIEEIFNNKVKEQFDEFFESDENTISDEEIDSLFD